MKPLLITCKSVPWLQVHLYWMAEQKAEQMASHSLFKQVHDRGQFYWERCCNKSAQRGSIPFPSRCGPLEVLINASPKMFHQEEKQHGHS